MLFAQLLGKQVLFRHIAPGLKLNYIWKKQTHAFDQGCGGWDKSLCNRPLYESDRYVIEQDKVVPGALGQCQVIKMVPNGWRKWCNHDNNNNNNKRAHAVTEIMPVPSSQCLFYVYIYVHSRRDLSPHAGVVRQRWGWPRRHEQWCEWALTNEWDRSGCFITDGWTWVFTGTYASFCIILLNIWASLVTRHVFPPAPFSANNNLNISQSKQS